MNKYLNEFGIKELQTRNDYLLQERDRLARRVVELESERDQLAVQNGRFRETGTIMSNVLYNMAQKTTINAAEQKMMMKTQKDWDSIRQRAKQSGVARQPRRYFSSTDYTVKERPES